MKTAVYRCPNCNRDLKISQQITRAAKIKCPLCDTSFSVTAPAVPPPAAACSRAPKAASVPRPNEVTVHPSATAAFSAARVLGKQHAEVDSQPAARKPAPAQKNLPVILGIVAGCVLVCVLIVGGSIPLLMWLFMSKPDVQSAPEIALQPAITEANIEKKEPAAPRAGTQAGTGEPRAETGSAPAEGRLPGQ